MVPTTLAYEAEHITEKLIALADLKANPIVLIDGRAGSGKSTFAELVRDGVFRETRQAPHLVHMDDLYPGWDGLREGSLYLNSQVLRPVVHSGVASWQTWNWSIDQRGGDDAGNGWRAFSGPNILLVEGCGAISKESVLLADLTIWITASDQDRKQRFLERDSGLFAEYWIPWSLQEDEFYLAEESDRLANVVISN